MTASRQPAGIPTGGQFAPTAQRRAQLSLIVDAPEVGSGLALAERPAPDLRDATTRRRALMNAADGLATDVGDPAQARVELRQLLDHLDPDDFERNVAAIAEAVQAVQHFEADPDAAYELPEGSPLWGEVHLGDYAGFDEDGCSGYDFEECTSALLDHWGQTRWRRTQDAWMANETAREAAGLGPAQKGY